ncbi:hypothetical protein TNIN_495851 [Trichonephila inaurata madagascariensis]|uniref:Uncharacterized protein n=1 Tax=Trichonephila inaurata madagascariensis TaxID=2747483 RepID=A0A8X6XVZ6_9ARAC|nr:hypothetical protein TNIN_495851 [Trichonephila inaurata madagascariensis]
MTRREAADERQVLSGRYIPGLYRGAVNKDKTVQPGRPSPYELCSRRHFSKTQELSRRLSPYPCATDCAAARYLRQLEKKVHT